MFIPFKDDNPLVTVRYQFVTLAILIINIAVFVAFQGALTGSMSEGQILSYGLVPAVLFGSADLVGSLQVVPPVATLATYMFFHGGWLHIISNMLFLWVFADNVEDQMGHARFALFYLLCGAGSGLVHALVLPASQSPMIGASGAIAGVIGAYLVMFPERKVWVLLFFGIPLKISALIVLGLWILTQVMSYSAGQYGDAQVAWIAHIAGFFIGAVLIFVMRRQAASGG